MAKGKPGPKPQPESKPLRVKKGKAFFKRSEDKGKK